MAASSAAPSQSAAGRREYHDVESGRWHPVTVDQAADGGAEDASSADTEPGHGRMRRLASPLLLIGVLAVFSVGLAAAMYFTEQRLDTQTADAAARSAVSAASKGAVAVLSYASESVDSDLASAKTHLTGEFLDYYRKFGDEVLGPTAKQKQITTKATVVRAAVSELHPHSARVLVFVNQTSSSKEKPFMLTTSSVIVSLSKSDGNWLISGFQPV